MQEHSYFFMVFGEEHAQRHPVEGEVYPHRRGHIEGSGIKPGDTILLYCGGNYPCHEQEAPGIGIVTCVHASDAESFIYYRYLPLDRQVPWDPDIKNNIAPTTPLNWVGNWLQKTNGASFRAALAGRQIAWP